MPRVDGSGPIGRGPMTGRGLGPCTGANAYKYGAGFGPGFGAGFGPGVGFGCRRGFGRGFGGYFNVDEPSANTAKEMLQVQKDMLQSRLEVIDKQLESF